MREPVGSRRETTADALFGGGSCCDASICSKYALESCQGHQSSKLSGDTADLLTSSRRCFPRPENCSPRSRLSVLSILTAPMCPAAAAVGVSVGVTSLAPGMGLKSTTRGL